LLVGLGVGGVEGWVELAELLELGEGLVEAVLEAAFVHSQAVEDPGAGEVLEDGAAEGEVVCGGIVGGSEILGAEGAGEFGEGAGVGGEEGVEDLGLEVFGAFESPGEADDAVGEGGFGGALGGQLGEHLVAVGLELARVFTLDDGLLGP
jgi:hypothetical protein